MSRRTAPFCSALVCTVLLCTACNAGAGGAIASSDVRAARALAAARTRTVGTGSTGRAVAVRIAVTPSAHPGAEVLCQITGTSPAGGALAITATATATAPAATAPGRAVPYPQCRVDPAIRAEVASLAPPAGLGLLAELAHDRVIGRATVDSTAATELEGVLPAGTPSALGPLGAPGVADVVDVWLDGAGRLVRYEAQFDPAASAYGPPADVLTVIVDVTPDLADIGPKTDLRPG